MKRIKIIVAIALALTLMVIGCGSSEDRDKSFSQPDYNVSLNSQSPSSIVPKLDPAGNLLAEVLVLDFIAGDDPISLDRIELNVLQSSERSPIESVLIYDGPTLVGWGYFMSKKDTRSAFALYPAVKILAQSVKTLRVVITFQLVPFFWKEEKTILINYVGSSGVNMMTGGYVQDETFIKGQPFSLFN